MLYLHIMCEDVDKYKLGLRKRYNTLMCAVRNCHLVERG